MDLYPILFGTLSSFWLGCAAIWGVLVWRNQHREPPVSPPPDGGWQAPPAPAPELDNVIPFPTRDVIDNEERWSLGALSAVALGERG